MVDLNYRWTRKTGRYQIGESLKLNRICVGGYSWNSAKPQSSKDASITWVGNIELPSLRDGSKRVYGGTEAEIRAKVEQIVTGWFNEALRQKP